MKYILASHGGYAEACMETCHMVTGDQGIFRAVSFFDTMSKEELLARMEEAMAGIDDEAAIICDIMGGTPFNCALELQGRYPGLKLAAGLSLGLCVLLAMQTPFTDALKESRTCVKLFQDMKEVPLDREEAETGDAQAAPAAAKTISQGFDLNSHLDEFVHADMAEKGIVHIRVDERLIHGQVATMWTNYVKAERILIIDDPTCRDDIAKIALRTAAPKTVKLSILTEQGAVKRINAGQYRNQRVLLLVKRPQVLYDLMKAGLNIQTFNVGNCSSHENTLRVKKSVYLYDEEISEIEEMLDQGIVISAQMVPGDELTDIREFLKTADRRGKA